MTPNRDGLKAGPIWLQPGISYLNFATFLYASLVTIATVVFVNISQPYILVENLGIEPGQEGTLTGQLLVFSELVVMLSIGLVGIMADRIGRKQIFALGLILFGITYLLYPTVESTWQLFAYRLFYALGVACATGMLGTVTNDYPQEISRGKLIAISGVLLGIGAVSTKLVIGGVPVSLVEGGVEPETAWTYTHWIVAGICFLSATILALGLKGGTPVKREKRIPIKQLFIRGFSEAKKPRTAYAYASAFVARSDLVIIGTFTLLWASSAGREMGLSQAEALARGGMLFGITQMAGLVWAPFMGAILDRYNRVACLAFGAFISCIGSVLLILVSDPFSNAYLPIFMLMGIGQISCFFSSQALIGQEAPVEARGAVIGAFGFCGALGILFFTGTGGILFDVWTYAGPFVFVGAATGILVPWGIFVYFKNPGESPRQPIKNATIVITGSTRGIGLGMAKEFLRRGNRVVVSGRTEESIKEALAELEPIAGADSVHGITCNVSDAKDVQSLWDKAQDRFKTIDIWINNAGVVNNKAPIEDLALEELPNVVNTNLLGVMYGSRVAIAGMRQQDGGHIYNFEGFGSDGMTMAGMGVYGSTKRAVTYLTKSLSKELKDTSVTISTINPGIVYTDLGLAEARKVPEERRARALRIFNTFGDRVEDVSPNLVSRILQNRKGNANITWMTKPKMLWRMIKSLFVKRDPLSELGIN